MAMWNPWRGCHRYSEGCKYCYIHKGDARRGVDTDRIVRTEGFDAPVRLKRDGTYRMKGGQTVYLCFSTDFLLEDADPWRAECWDMIRRRPDLRFLFLTKRIERFAECAPPDWGGGYDNVTVGCTVENQARADRRLSLFAGLPIRHRNVICQPLIGPMEIEPYLDGVELVVAGGESDRCARPLDYGWVLSLREQCMRRNVPFQFRQCGTHFVRDGRTYTIPTRELCAQARRAGIDFPGNAGEGPHSEKQEEQEMQFNKTTIRVLVRKDYGACFDFYTEKLGLVPVWGDRNGPYTSFAVPGDAAPCFAIFAGEAMPMFQGYTPPASGGQPDTVVAVVPSTDLDGDYRRLKEAGVAFLGEPQSIAEWGMRCTYFRDPEGNLFELNDASGV